MSKTMVVRHYLITGRVQGVGFRRFVQKQAQGLSLIGKTRNLYDGRVEILARGPATVMDVFERIIAKGPMFASVSDLKATKLEGALSGFNDLTGFVILEDGETPWSINC